MKERTIYDQGAEEYGRPQRSFRTIGGESQYDDDDFGDVGSERHPTQMYYYENFLMKTSLLASDG